MRTVWSNQGLLFRFTAVITISLFLHIVLVHANLSIQSNSFPFRNKFETNFVEKCQRYPFVKRFLEQKYDSTGKYFIHVMQHPKLDNGGLGDRLGGVLSAVAYSIRWNRTLVLQTSNGFGKLFQPYYFAEKQDSSTDISVEDEPNSGSKHMSWDTWRQWIKLNESAYNETRYSMYVYEINSPNDEAMSSDPAHPIVRQVSNRAFLCRWEQRKDMLAYQQVRDVLGITDEVDLYEVGGCLLRLALWPTELLWRKVQRKFERLSATNIVASDDILNEYNQREMSRSLRLSELSSGPLSRDSFMVALHCRCGDNWNKHGKYTDDCPSAKMGYGTPEQLGNCGKEILRNAAASHPGRLKQVLMTASDNYHAALRMTAGAPLAPHTHVLVSNSTCHINKDHSFRCTAHTVLHWFMMALSDVIVVQSQPHPEHEFLVSSGYSRMAIIYSLMGAGSYRVGRFCTDNSTRVTPAPKNLSRLWTGNWMC